MRKFIFILAITFYSYFCFATESYETPIQQAYYYFLHLKNTDSILELFDPAKESPSAKRPLRDYLAVLWTMSYYSFKSPSGSWINSPTYNVEFDSYARTFFDKRHIDLANVSDPSGFIDYVDQFKESFGRVQDSSYKPVDPKIIERTKYESIMTAYIMAQFEARIESDLGSMLEGFSCSTKKPL